MRHVKVRPDVSVNEAALRMLIRDAYTDMKARLAGPAVNECLSLLSEKVAKAP